MATKDLGRTPLEAGNTAEYHSVRREVRRRYRHEARTFCRNAARDPETCEEIAAPIAPEHRRPEGCWPSDMHGDRVSPVKRWIHRQVGRRWDDVYSEIRSRFNVRTLAGRHIVDSHLLGYVDADGNLSHSYRDLVVDEDGVLREREDRYPRHHYRTERKTVSDRKFTRWLSGRKVGQRRAGSWTVLYWFTATGNTRREERWVSRKRADHWGWETVRLPAQIMTYRQGRPLSQKEIAFYERLTSAQRAKAAEDLVLGRIVRRDRKSPWWWQAWQSAAPAIAKVA